jgi:hypothetical protein
MVKLLEFDYLFPDTQIQIGQMRTRNKYTVLLFKLLIKIFSK